MPNTNVYVDENELYNIANSLRYKLNTSNTFLPSEMGPAVENISGGGANLHIQDGSMFFETEARLSDMNGLIPYFDNSITNMYQMFWRCENLVSVPNFNTHKVTNMCHTFGTCSNLVTVPDFNTSNVTDMVFMFRGCNNLSNASVQNIINMCLNSNITNSMRKNLRTENLSSPFYDTTITNSRYSNRLSELNAAGWLY